MVTAKDVLIEAKKLIETGWTQGLNYWYDEKNERDCYCALGAIFYNKKTTNFEIVEEAESILLKVIKSDNIVTWNDATYRTKEDVIVTFEKAIEMA